SVTAFSTPDVLKIAYNKTTKKCLNSKLLSVLDTKFGYKYHREFQLGGSGIHCTHVLALHKHNKIPTGTKQYFLQHIMRRGLECLEETSKTITHGIPHGDLYDSSETLKLFQDDANIVWRHIDTILTEDRYS
ncbi:hypothetical protein JTB14_026714, partial [Gonioctena quinquepunctata]